MGVYIPNIEMPKSCDDCPHPTCTLWQSVNGWERNEKCPIVPVPPHGRLIDADALMKEIQETCKRLYGTDDINTASPTLSAFKLYIGEAPTVIEAEEET